LLWQTEPEVAVVGSIRPTLWFIAGAVAALTLIPMLITNFFSNSKMREGAVMLGCCSTIFLLSIAAMSLLWQTEPQVAVIGSIRPTLWSIADVVAALTLVLMLITFFFSDFEMGEREEMVVRLYFYIGLPLFVCWAWGPLVSWVWGVMISDDMLLAKVAVGIVGIIWTLSAGMLSGMSWNFIKRG
jgi:hypothetical protein